jgi:transcriptional regulator with XRE-family HTH domain
MMYNMGKITKEETAMDSKLKTIRLAHGLSQSQLAAAAGINGRVLQNYEQDVRDLSGAKLATLLKICIALHCKLEDILPDGETTTLLGQYTAML